MTVRRGFVDVAAGVQVHFRTAGSGGPRPLVILHPSPGSSKMMEPLIIRAGSTRLTFGLDTLGNGDSSPSPDVAPDVVALASAQMAAIDALGLDQIDLYGSHTGAYLAVEIALAWPDRVRHLILDGVSSFTPDERADMLANHAPPITIAPDASHLLWAWNFVRDAFIFWPWYKRDGAHLRGTDVPSTDALHDKFVEVIKAARTYHLSYNAALRYDHGDRLGRIAVPTLLTCARDDMLLAYFDEVAALMPRATRYVAPGLTGPAREEAVVRFLAFLDDAPAG